MVGSVTFLPVGEPSTLDRYQLIGEIASGGMAVVYLARLVGVGGFSRLVAIKRLHPHLAGEREFVEMFVDEARLAAGIHHQNVVGLKEIGMTDNGYYLVMDYIDGVTLATLLSELSAKKRKLPIPIVLRLLVDTLSGLHAAHELVDETTGAPLGVVHRDCTPQNILVGMDGSPRLTDFGIARATSRIANTRDGAMKGKLAYMAPEQTKGDGIDRRADLFSVGVVMWEALSGRRLFRGSTEAETLRRLLVEPIPSLLATAAIHQSLSDVCAVALEREPAERFQTAVQMIEAIEETARE
jgi:serine/threonine-protein kinase